MQGCWVPCLRAGGGQAWSWEKAVGRWPLSPPSCPSAHYLQGAGVTLPAGSRVTALVPFESAIRKLSPDDQAFWLRPKMLPQLVRWAARAGPREMASV